MNSMEPRGIRNANPLNIRVSRDQWQGLSPKQSDDEFFTFETPEWGIRAAARTLQTYQERHGIDTLRYVISRWAPPSENDTSAYITAVSIWADIEPDDQLAMTDYDTVYRLLRAMVRMENGKPPEDRDPAWYEPEVWERGLRLAGLSPSKPLSKSRTTRGVATSAAGGLSAAITVLIDKFGVAPDLANQLPAVLSGMDSQTVTLISLVIVIGGAMFAGLARRDDKLNGRL